MFPDETDTRVAKRIENKTKAKIYATQSKIMEYSGDSKNSTRRIWLMLYFTHFFALFFPAFRDVS